MTLFAFALLADENINPEVVAGLRALGCQVVTVAELELAGAPDTAILQRAMADGRVVLTHDPRRTSCPISPEEDEDLLLMLLK